MPDIKNIFNKTIGEAGLKKISVLVFLIVTLFTQNLLSQPFWEETNYSNFGAVRSLAVNSNGHIFAGSYYEGIFRSTDNGNSWPKVYTTDTYISSIVINSNGDIFASSYFIGSTEGIGVLRSTDNGDNWTLVNNGLTSTNVEALAFNSNGHIFAGTSEGGI